MQRLQIEYVMVMKDETTILIVEDDLLNLELISEGLVEKGYDIIKAESGIEALRILESTTKTIKVIILDWMMPEMSGIELMGLLKEDNTFKHIPVIVQTAKAQPEDIVQGLDSGAYQYLVKPFEDEVLFSMVRSAVAEYERFQTVVKKADEDLKEMRTTAFKEKIRWRTP
jgi:sigma-B regulation protein RsbU (phosphoserine phosphatase)